MKQIILAGRAAVVAVVLAATLAACGGGSGPSTLPPATGGGGGTPGLPSPGSAPALKTTLAANYGVANFPVGAAIEADSTTGTGAALLQKHFSSITAENAMKADTVWPSKAGISPAVPADSPNFAPADVLVNFAAANNIQVRGHTLLWHQTAPTWFFVGDINNAVNYRADLKLHLHTYIDAVMKHFPNVYAWDVVNEVASDTPNDPISNAAVEKILKERGNQWELKEEQENNW